MALITWLDKIDGSDLGNPQKNVNAADMNQIKTAVNTNDSNNTSAHSTLSSATATVQTNLDTHIADSTAAHAASAISNTAAGNISATTVQAAINELDTEKAATGSVSTVATDLSNHIADTTAAHAGTAISNTPSGNIAATTVQAAINELDTEKAPIASPTFTGVPAGPTASPGTNTTQFATTAFVQAVGALIPLLTSFVTRETPTGSINGINTVYTLANTPIVDSECGFKNGLLQDEGDDYTISGVTVTFAVAPATGSKLVFNYRK